MSLKGMYAYALKVAEGKFHGTTEERDGKLVWNGTVATEAEKNAIWDAIKTIPDWRRDIAADIRVTGGPADGRPGAVPSGAAASGTASRDAARTYTVKPGDTLSQIAKDRLGNAGAYVRIFELNRDQLDDPDRIRPGQVLRLP